MQAEDTAAIALEGWVFDIQRFSLHDGPGIRTTVFLKGCPLHCLWCHNPEGMVSEPQVRVVFNLCVRCGRCVRACVRGRHMLTPNGHELRPDGCILCGECVEACAGRAIETVGQRMTVEGVMGVVRRDVPFYEQSGGGMTLSGGEPLSQPGFSLALLETAKREGMHTVVETSACAPWGTIERFASVTDLFILDLKHTDESRHHDLTGISNHRILANTHRMLRTGWPLVLRVCWVPTMNAEDSFLEGLVELLGPIDPKPPVELLLYHRLGIGKWRALGGESTMPEELPAATREQAARWVERLEATGVSVKVQ